MGAGSTTGTAAACVDLRRLGVALGAAAVLLGSTCQPAAALPPPPVGPAIADAPPAFRIYDVDRRERNMRRLLGQLYGTPALSPAKARAALGELDRIKAEERRLRAQHGGRLTVSTIRIVDARLNAVARRLDVREPTY